MPRTLFFDPKILDHQLDLVHHPKPNKLQSTHYTWGFTIGYLAIATPAIVGNSVVDSRWYHCRGYRYSIVFYMLMKKLSENHIVNLLRSSGK